MKEPKIKNHTAPWFLLILGMAPVALGIGGAIGVLAPALAGWAPAILLLFSFYFALYPESIQNKFPVFKESETFIRKWQLPSSINVPWELKVFIGYSMGSIILSSLFVLCGFASAAPFAIIIGGTTGILFAALYPIMAKWFFKKSLTNQEQHPPQPARAWYAESTHNMPIYIRLFAAAMAAGALAAVFPFLPAAPYLVLSLCAVAALSPLCFAMLRKFNIISTPSTQVGDAPPENSIWHKQSKLDVPWYLRLFTGSTIALLLLMPMHALAIISLPVMIGLSAAIISSALLSPAIFNLLDIDSVDAGEGTKETILHDLPWFLRLFVGALGGLALAHLLAPLAVGVSAATLQLACVSAMGAISLVFPLGKYFFGSSSANRHILHAPTYFVLFTAFLASEAVIQPLSLIFATSVPVLTVIATLSILGLALYTNYKNLEPESTAVPYNRLPPDMPAYTYKGNLELAQPAQLPQPLATTTAITQRPTPMGK